MTTLLRAALAGWCCCLLLTICAPLIAWWGNLGAVIAFQRSTPDADAEIYVVDVWTRITVNVTRWPGSDRFPAWSPGGEWLAFQSFRPGQSPTETLYLQPFSTRGGVQGLLPGDVSGTLPDWSPDGCCIAFSAYDNNTFSVNVYVLHLMSEHIWNIAPTPGTNQFGPVWSPDGGRVAFAAAGNDQFDRQQIYSVPVVVPADGAGVTPDEAPRLLRHSRGGGRVTPTWSADGERLFFVDAISLMGTATLFYADITGDGFDVRLPNTDNAQHPDVSPDGERLVYSAPSRRDTGSRVLYISHIDGTDARQLTYPDERYVQDTAPAWRP